MGSCAGKKIQTPLQQASETYFTNQRHSTRVTFFDKYIQQPKEYDIKPFDPCCHQCQYNVEVEGVVFDVIAPPDLLDEDNLEPFEEEE